MPLSPAVPRRHLHTRRIHCEGFARDDGLWDIEARMIDTKTYGFTDFEGVGHEPGGEVHNMWIRLTLDDDYLVRDIEVDMDTHPYAECRTAMPSYKGLVGARVGLGWRKAVQQCVGGTKGCTHLRELLFPMATVAFQTIGAWRAFSQRQAAGATLQPGMPLSTDPAHRPYFVDGCKSWAADGPVVARLYPALARRPEP